MVGTNRTPMDEDPVVMHDESWWESVLSDEERPAVVPQAHKSYARPHSRPEHQSAAGQPKKRGAAARQPKPAHQAGRAGAHSSSQPEPMALLSHADWDYAMEVHRQDEIVTLTVTSFNRGGLLVEAERLQGFVPYSHLVDMTCQNDVERDHFLAEYVGRDLRLKIIECVPDEGRIVFSERAARADAGRRTELFSLLKVGDVVNGEVTNITDFGAFVDLGGVEGLIHISELSWARVVHPSHILKLGQKVEVQVLDVLPERCRIALSLKRLQPNPWESVARVYAINDVVPATITSVASFGVFARLQEGLEGLVHVSEIEPTGQPLQEIFKEGQQISVRILHIEPEHQRLGLSLKLDGK